MPAPKRTQAMSDDFAMLMAFEWPNVAAQ
jgi:hypothetical protein